jgi:D-arabinose 1-dehydrogenase-like Zn-dependent alcohol dehydrogenase
MRAAIVRSQGNLVVEDIPEPVVGHESIGRVVERGSRVRHLAVGDLVARTGARDTPGLKATWGGFAELGLGTDFQAMREDGLAEAQWKPFAINQTLPAGADPAAATMMITWRETHSYISRLGVKPGSRLLILGSGGNGFSFAVLARALGVGSVAMLGNPRWAHLAARAGVETFADYRDPAAIETLRAAAPEGFDAVIDAVGSTGGIEAVADLLTPDAVVGMYGIEALGERMAALARLRETGRRVHGPGEYSEAEAHEAVVALLEAGALDAGLWFDTAAAPDLADIATAIAAIEAGRSLKAVVRLSS